MSLAVTCLPWPGVLHSVVAMEDRKVSGQESLNQLVRVVDHIDQTWYEGTDGYL